MYTALTESRGSISGDPRCVAAYPLTTNSNGQTPPTSIGLSSVPSIPIYATALHEKFVSEFKGTPNAGQYVRVYVTAILFLRLHDNCNRAEPPRPTRVGD